MKMGVMCANLRRIVNELINPLLDGDVVNFGDEYFVGKLHVKQHCLCLID